MAITTNVQKSFIKAIAPVFSALFMKKREKTPKNHQMNLVSENFKEQLYSYMIEISFKIILWQMCSIFLLKIQKLFANLRKLLKLKNAIFFF